jgi:Winged helix DNA-binding domain
VDVVRATCGIHAQVMAAAELSLAARIDGLTRDGVHDALWRERSLVKAWTVRGTLHLHPADELPLWYAARRAIRDQDEGALLKPWRDPNGVEHPALAPDDVRAVREAVHDVLADRCLLREELVDEVVRRVGPAPRERLRSGFAFFLEEVCQGPPQGQKVTFARPDKWIAGWRDVDVDEALRTVCRRFVGTYGPTRPSDFREWFGGGLTRADARALFQSLAAELEEVDVEGHAAFVLVGDVTFPQPRPSLRLLPEYDVYVMGFREREHLVPGSVREQVARDGRGRYEGPAGVRFLTIDGVAAGLWQREKRGRTIELRVRPVEKPTRSQRAELERETRRIGAFLGLQPALTLA